MSTPPENDGLPSLEKIFPSEAPAFSSVTIHIAEALIRIGRSWSLIPNRNIFPPYNFMEFGQIFNDKYGGEIPDDTNKIDLKIPHIPTSFENDPDPRVYRDIKAMDFFSRIPTAMKGSYG